MSGTETAVPGLPDLLPADAPGRDGMIAKFKGVPDLAAAYHALESRQHSSKVYPGADAPLDQVVAFMREIGGAPKDPSGYTIPSGVPSGEPIEKLRTAAAEVGISKSQFPKLAETVAAVLPKDPSSTWREETKRAWGKDYDQNLALVNAGLERISGAVPGLREALAETKAIDHPKINEMLLLFGKRLQNDQAPVSMVVGGMNDDAARKLAAEWRVLAASPSTDRQSHPDFQKNVERMHELRRQLREAGYPNPLDPKLAPLTSAPQLGSV